MTPHDRAALMHRGLDDIFDPQLRSSIAALLDDVRERGDVAVCDALRILDGIDLEPDQLAGHGCGVRDGRRDGRGRRCDRRRDRPPAGVQRGADGTGRGLDASRANPASSSARRSPRSLRSGCSPRPARPAIRASPISSRCRPSSPAFPTCSLVVPPIPGGSGAIDPAVLVVCRKLGISNVFRVNGPAGIAALGFGTEIDPKVAQDRRSRLAGGHDRTGRDAASRRRRR